MKFKGFLSKQTLLNVICLLFIMLFVYASCTKLMDMTNFQVQIGQSPLLSSFAGWISWGVIIVELVAAALLIFDKTRQIGLYLSFVLMTMFTTYIIIILNFSPFVPCSCGGVLEKMSWDQHVIFNILFMLLSVLGILFISEKKRTTNSHVKSTVLLFTCFILSIVSITVLFFLSEDIIHKRNNFVRRFPQHPVVLKHELDLKNSSYYIAGIDEEQIYLSNKYALTHIKILNNNLETIDENKLTISDSSLPYRSPSLIVSKPDLYFIDGYVPIIIKGKIDGWKATDEYDAKAFFSLIAHMDSVSFAIRARDSKTNEDILGILKIGNSSSVLLSHKLLKKQIDGVFDTDGSLLYNKQLNRIIYIYYYRNQFIVANKDLTLEYAGKTIDTVSKAKLSVQYISAERGTKLSSPPLIVNKHMATYGNHLFIHSNLMSRFEPKETWKASSVIDVYDIVKNTYLFSFYIPNKGNVRLSEFFVFKNTLVCLIGNYIQLHKMDENLFD